MKKVIFCVAMLALTASVAAQEKRVYFSYDSPVNVILTIYGDGDGVMVEATINGKKIVGKIEYKEEIFMKGQFNERYDMYYIFYEDTPSFCSDGKVFILYDDWEEDEKSIPIRYFYCKALLGNSDGEMVKYLHLINQPDNIKLLEKYDGYRNMNNIQLMNDKAYYLEQLGAYAESIYILKKVLSKSPDRVVAYLNIADAYWGNNEKNEARKSYEKYIELMKNQGKDMKKIPQRVYDRIKAEKK